MKPQQEQLRMVQAKKHRAPSDTTHCCVPQVLTHSSFAMSRDATHSQIYQQQLLKKPNACLHQWGRNCSPSGFCSCLCHTGHECATVADTLRVNELQ